MLTIIWGFSESQSFCWYLIFLNIVRITNMWHRDMKWANAVGKMAPVGWLDAGLPQTFGLTRIVSKVAF